MSRSAMELKIYVYDLKDVELIKQLIINNKEKSKNDLYLKLLRKGAEFELYNENQHIFAGPNKKLIETTFNNKLNRFIKYMDFQFTNVFKLLNMIQEISVFTINAFSDEQGKDLNALNNPKEIMFQKLDWMKKYAEQLEKEFNPFEIKDEYFKYEK
ncbi:hypothetical protein C6B38_05570 [Spiroplasma sp. ChiS]|nr:hypothetical protein [Spiroplasma sp. ChiS]PQP78500.1 hypothetical protein C6B38_05570 [Spiroplasma sp. ChiS]